MAFVQGVAGDEFYITMDCGIQAKAKSSAYTVTTQGPQKFDPTLQKPIVDSVTASKPDAMLIAPTDVTAMQAPLEQAAEAGIKVVLVDTTLNNPSFAVSQIASDNVGGGAAAFDAIKAAQARRRQGPRHLHRPRYLHRRRPHKGFEEAAAEADPTFKYLGVQYDHDDPATRPPRLAALQKDPDITASSRPTCSPPRAPPPACARRARGQ